MDDTPDPSAEGQEGPDSRYWSGAHTRHRLLVHLVFIPKYRRRVLQGPVAARLEALLRQAAEVKRWHIQELAIQPDHMHLLLQMHPRESIASVVKVLKGGTSRVLRTEYPELEEFLWGESFWSDGYFVETVGRINEAAVSDYIRRQSQRLHPPPESATTSAARVSDYIRRQSQRLHPPPESATTSADTAGTSSL